MFSLLLLLLLTCSGQVADTLEKTPAQELSYADLIALAGAHAVAVCGSPVVDVPVGRHLTPPYSHAQLLAVTLHLKVCCPIASLLLLACSCQVAGALKKTPAQGLSYADVVPRRCT
jgi:hypothetical protein